MGFLCVSERGVNICDQTLLGCTTVEIGAVA